MHALKRAEILCGMLFLALAVAGCQTDTTTTTNTNTTANTNMTANANAAATPVMSAATIETREPEQYKATLVFSGSADGKPQGVQLPVEVARSGDNRRYAFNIPAIGQLIFLDRADKRYLILPGRKQYAEITPELIGFDVRSLTPGQMVVMLQKQQGVERVGEEQREGRTVIKYRYAATAKTGSQAGDVSAESSIYVDKETGLPLHADMSGQSSGNVQGVSRARLVADMRDIQTTVDPTLFELPTGLTKLSEAEIKQQVAVLGQFLQFALGALNSQMGGSGAPSGSMTTTPPPPASGATASPAASPAMSPVASPTR